MHSKIDQNDSSTASSSDDRSNCLKGSDKMLDYLTSMRTTSDGGLIHNDYATILSCLKDYCTRQNKHNYQIVTSWREKLNERTACDFVQKKKECSLNAENRERLQVEETQAREDQVARQIFQNPRPFDPSLSFQKMSVSPCVIKALEDVNIVQPTSIQIGVIPEALEGKDICGCAITGSGKTLAFLIPVVEKLLKKKKQATTTLIVVPSRELGVQIHEVGEQLCKYTKIKLALVVGGLSIVDQRKILWQNPDVIIATPGRLIDHIIKTKGFSMETIDTVILDEADQMLSAGFTEQMKEVLNRCSQDRQTLLFSATLSETVKDLSVAALKNPVRIFTNENKELTSNLHQEFIMLEKGNEDQRLPILLHIVLKLFRKRVILFAQMKAQCTYIFVLLTVLGFRCAELHSDKDQDERNLALERFKTGQIDILVATDVAARGIDVSNVQTIINLYLPENYQQYVHRVGRTARAGASGRSVSIVNQEDKKDLGVLTNICNYGTGVMTRRYAPYNYLRHFIHAHDRITPLVERIQKRIEISRKSRTQERNLKRMIGRAERKASKHKSRRLITV